MSAAELHEVSPFSGGDTSATEVPESGATTTTGLDLTSHWVTFSAEQLAIDPPDKEFVWAGRIPLGDVGVFAAEGGSGKTALLTGLAIHRAMGMHFLGKPVRQGTTVIVTTEDCREDYLRKIAAWRSSLPFINLEKVAKHVHLIDLAGVPFRLVQSHFGDYVPTEHPKMLAEAVKAKAPDADLIIIETTSRVGAGEGNEALSALVVAAEQLAHLSKASVLLVSHVSQEAGRRAIGDAYAPRGGSALGANGRYTLTLTRFTDENLAEMLPGVTVTPQQRKELSVFRVPKINSAPREDPTILQIVTTHWGLTLRVYETGHAQSPEERQRTTRQSIGESLRDLAERMSKVGSPLTRSRLEGLSKEVPGLAKNRISAAVLHAIEDGFLREVERQGRGGGFALLPGELQRGSQGDP